MKMNVALISIFIVFQMLLSSCEKDDDTSLSEVDYRGEMRDFVVRMGAYARNFDSDFFIIPQNGQELITDNGEGDGKLQKAYVEAIDATGRESMFYGYYNDDEQTPDEDKQHLLDLCRRCEENGIEVLATDYCFTKSKVDDSYRINAENGFVSFAADERDLNNVPAYPVSPHHVNSDDITDVSQIKNFLYLINSEKFDTKQEFISTVSDTDYDALIMDLYHNEVAYTPAEIAQLKLKKNGGKRLVFCYMSIGEAEDYRYYWKSDWKVGSPSFLDREDPNWKGNFYVRYWDRDWQDIIFGNDDSYLKKILGVGFDGVYLDLIDAFEYFEEEK